MGAWIEIANLPITFTLLVSHPTMGAWIEISKQEADSSERRVAPHDGCVD